MAVATHLTLGRLEYADSLLIHANRWLQTVDASIPEFSQDEALNIVDVIIRDSVDNRMRWLTPRHYRIDDVIAKIVESRIQGTKAAHLFYDEVVDDIWTRIDGIIGHFIPDRTWSIWYIRTLGNSTRLEEGSDYRIVDWERKMESGEWQLG